MASAFDVAFDLLKADLFFGDRQSDNNSDLFGADLRVGDNREQRYTDFPNDLAEYHAGSDVRSDEAWGHALDYPVRSDPEHRDVASQRKLIARLKNADVNNAMWGAHLGEGNIHDMGDDERSAAISAAREKVAPGKLHTEEWYGTRLPIDERGEVRGPHWFWPNRHRMLTNLEPESMDAKWVDNEFNPLAVAPMDQKFSMPDISDDGQPIPSRRASLQNLADEMKNASEPMVDAWSSLLKSNILKQGIPGGMSDLEWIIREQGPDAAMQHLVDNGVDPVHSQQMISDYHNSLPPPALGMPGEGAQLDQALNASRATASQAPPPLNITRVPQPAPDANQRTLPPELLHGAQGY